VVLGARRHRQRCRICCAPNNVVSARWRVSVRHRHQQDAMSAQAFDRSTPGFERDDECSPCTPSPRPAPLFGFATLLVVVSAILVAKQHV
jgi:hypothetical protein